MTAIDSNPANKNFLSPISFKFMIKKAPHVNFFIQQVTVPRISLPSVETPNPFVSLPKPGDHIDFDTLSIKFKVDEDLQNYLKTIPLSAPLPKKPTFVDTVSRNTTVSANNSAGPFKVKTDRSYFHTNANTSTRRAQYIIKGQGGTFTKVENNFGYLTFTYNGKTTEGWLPISDVQFS